MEKNIFQNTIIDEHRLAFSDVLAMKEAIINNNFDGEKGRNKWTLERMRRGKKCNGLNH